MLIKIKMSLEDDETDALLEHCCTDLYGLKVSGQVSGVTFHCSAMIHLSHLLTFQLAASHPGFHHSIMSWHGSTEHYRIRINKLRVFRNPGSSERLYIGTA